MNFNSQCPFKGYAIENSLHFYSKQKCMNCNSQGPFKGYAIENSLHFYSKQNTFEFTFI
jgi:hypothetical protein